MSNIRDATVYSRFEAIIFDLDGTLVDSAPIVGTILNELRFELGLATLPLRSFYDWISLGGADLVVNALGIEKYDADIYLSKFRTRYFEMTTPRDSVYPNVFSMLSRLRKNGFKLSICTNKPRRLVDKVLLETELSGYFDYVLAGDDISTKKPNPENVDKCLLAMNATPGSVVLVGDSTVDEASARNSGVEFAFFSEGYDDGVDRQSAIISFSDHADFLHAICPGGISA